MKLVRKGKYKGVLIWKLDRWARSLQELIMDIDDITMDSCEGGRMSAYITPSMEMMPCSYADKKLAIPITKKKDISYIWNRSMPFRSFRSILKKKPFSCPAGF